ncbi:MAG: hypothetical protein ACTHKC_00375 [Candidatus Nitrosocosmicus sp.]
MTATKDVQLSLGCGSIVTLECFADGRLLKLCEREHNKSLKRIVLSVTIENQWDFYR